jgi:hypothetical protein
MIVAQETFLLFTDHSGGMASRLCLIPSTPGFAGKYAIFFLPSDTTTPLLEIFPQNNCAYLQKCSSVLYAAQDEKF